MLIITEKEGASPNGQSTSQTVIGNDLIAHDAGIIICSVSIDNGPLITSDSFTFRISGTYCMSIVVLVQLLKCMTFGYQSAVGISEYGGFYGNLSRFARILVVSSGEENYSKTYQLHTVHVVRLNVSKVELQVCMVSDT